MFGLTLRTSSRVSSVKVNEIFGKNSGVLSKIWGANMSQKPQSPPIETAMRNALESELNPVFLDVTNESPMHNTPKQAESHFRVLVVSEKFNDLSLIKRHRLVNDTIKTALREAGFEFIHALSIEAKTPKQWSPDHEPEKSPPCLGGFGK